MDVEVDVANEVVVKPSNQKIVLGHITDFDQQLSQFIFSENVFKNSKIFHNLRQNLFFIKTFRQSLKRRLQPNT